MDVKPMNFTQTVDATKIVEVVAEVAIEAAGVETDLNVLQVVEDFKADIRTITNLTRLIEQTPINGLTENLIAWDAIERLLAAFGLTEVLDVQVAKEFVQSIEDTLMDPEALIEDVTGVNITAVVETAIEENFPTIPTVEQLEAIELNFSGYVPMLDITGPFAFFPSHCYPDGVAKDDDEKGMNEATQYNSPVIAYVKTGASIEEDVI